MKPVRAGRYRLEALGDASRAVFKEANGQRNHLVHRY